MEKKVEKAFYAGLRELRVKDVLEVKEKIKEILGVTTKQSLIRYAAGRGNLDVEKAAQIEQVFKDYGVDNCWGL